MLDDFHVISSPKQPISILQKSTAIHMATSLIDIPTNVPAIKRPSTREIHRNVDVQSHGVVKTCRGGICSTDVVEIIEDYLDSQKCYLESLPHAYKTINPESVEIQVKELG